MINWKSVEIDEELIEEIKYGDGKWFNKVTGKIEDRKIDIDREYDYFQSDAYEIEEDRESIKSYEKCIVESDKHNKPSYEQPDITYQLEYAYGYRAENSRMNVYYNSEGKIVYFTASLGVILCQKTNTQTFFGDGEADITNKKVPRNQN